MTNEQLITILLEFPLDYEVEQCKPLIENGTIKFRAGCDQSHCRLMEQDEAKIKKAISTSRIIKGALTAKGKDKSTPDAFKEFMRGIYGALNEMEGVICQ